MATAFACETEIDERACIAVFHREQDAKNVAWRAVVAINPLDHFHEAALAHAERIGVIYKTDQSWRKLRPLFGE